MSSALTMIVIGQVYILNTPTNVSTIGSVANDTSNIGGAIRDDYIHTPGVGFHKLHIEPATWSNAELTCEEEGGHLAVINSLAESETLAKMILKLGTKSESESGNWRYAFIGFRKRLHGSGYVTVRGESLEKAGFDVWAATEPNNLHDSEHCGSVYMDGKLNDINCDHPFNFICELPDLSFGLPQPIKAPENQEPCKTEQTTDFSIQDIRPA